MLLLHLSTLLNDSSILSVGLSQSTRTVCIATQRGTVYDRYLQPLNNTGIRYCGALVPELEQLSMIRDTMTQSEYQRLTKEIHDQTLLIAELTSANYAGKKLRTFAVPKRYEKYVPCVHLLGYLQEDGTQGQCGIEKAYHTILEQYTGSVSVTYPVNGIGKCHQDATLKVKNTLKQCAGGVQLTVDRYIQTLVDDLAPRYIRKGAVIVLDVPTGEVLAATSLPTFHPEEIQETIESRNGALVNRYLSRYDCGSIFKIVTAAAALEHGISPQKSYTCPGEILVENTLFHCHQRLGHHTLTMEEAFAQSCNVYFIQLAQEIGAEALLNTAKAFGLYDPIDLAQGICAPGSLIPDLSALYPAALANLSFGQGELLISPLHVASMTAAIANNGLRITPTVVLATVDDEKTAETIEKGRGESSVSPATIAALQRMMEQTVSCGTGTRAQPKNTTAAGKTGTAETGQRNGDFEVVQSWFTGYFPTDNPRYAITILAEDAQNNGGDAQGLFCELAEILSRYYGRETTS